MWDSLNREDLSVLEQLQQGRRSPAYDGGRLSPHWEGPTHQFGRPSSKGSLRFDPAHRTDGTGRQLERPGPGSPDADIDLERLQPIAWDAFGPPRETGAAMCLLVNPVSLG
ncbi:MAG: hypothetical protein CM1200mP20_10090 [Pseudomonadota bacterium]|nr:MAG: hypothetical protein CM1200mP20_10090 [Pseudomonadota bacterium]